MRSYRRWRIRVSIHTALNRELTWDKAGTTTGRRKRINVCLCMGQGNTGTKGKLQAEILKSGAQGINNMDNTTEEIGQEGQDWECPLCGKRGDRRGIYGVCRHSPCRGVRTEGTFRDRAETRKRKVLQDTPRNQSMKSIHFPPQSTVTQSVPKPQLPGFFGHPPAPAGG